MMQFLVHVNYMMHYYQNNRRKSMKIKTTLTIASVLWSTSVIADLPYNPTFNWTPPSEFTDNSPLNPSTDLSGYKIVCTGNTDIVLDVPPDVSTYTPQNKTFTAGDYSCYMTAISIDGISSAPSDTVNFTIDQAAPKPVINFSIN